MKRRPSKVTVGRCTFVSYSGQVSSSQRQPAVRVPKGLDLTARVVFIKDLPDQSRGPIAHSKHYRTDRHFNLNIEIEVSGSKVVVLPSHLHLYREHGRGGEAIRGYEPGWIGCLDLNVDNEPDGFKCDECLECNGNLGRSGPLTAGDTNKAVGIAVREAMAKHGFDISIKYHDYVNKPELYSGPLSLFTMRVPLANVLGEATGRHGGIPLIGEKKRICCPVHGERVQKELEPAF
jgi:hypothetical protein